MMRRVPQQLQAGALLIAFAEMTMLLRVQPFAIWNFPVLWWGYILTVDGLGEFFSARSMLKEHPGGGFLQEPRVQHRHPGGVRDVLAPGVAAPAGIRWQEARRSLYTGAAAGHAPRHRMLRARRCGAHILLLGYLAGLHFSARALELSPWRAEHAPALSRRRPRPYLQAHARWAHLRHLLGVLELLGLSQMAVHHPVAGLPQGLRDAGPRLSYVSPLCAGGLCDVHVSHVTQPDAKKIPS